jgi:hypothetical protein
MEWSVSMQPRSWPGRDPVIAAAIRSMYRGKRQPPLPVRVRDELGELLPMRSSRLRSQPRVNRAGHRAGWR